MEAPSLTLVVLQGPRRGETFDFRPGSTVRIGRVVRGNTLAIKDAGISSKHLEIDSNSGKWTVEDLDSSNGTTLNSSQLPPLLPSDLRDGDEIKLGELTSVMVRLRIENPNPLPPLQRGRRKQVGASVKLAEPEARVLAEESQLPPSVPKRGRPRKARVPASQKSEPPPPVVGRVTRSRKSEIDCSTSDCVELGIPEKKKNAPPARRGRKKEPAPSPENDDVVLIEIKDGPEFGASLAEKAREGGGDRISVVEIKSDSDCEAHGGDANRVSVVEIKGNEGLEPKLAEEAQQGVGCEAVVDEQQCEAPAKDGPNSDEHAGEKSEEPDLEKMTLREWFKYMEVRLTKQTVEASEKMIDEMRKKAARVQEYIDEQKKMKKAS
ncbi:unnamed protein product [Linum tenue]|uniref:FHA domain-containing protein n=1 Tax=Linum tenue TaxID=586396 RepID=A0AAV0LUF5_9ROSI|nr:unnamed protein product [Linum tenue]